MKGLEGLLFLSLADKSFGSRDSRRMDGFLERGQADILWPVFFCSAILGGEQNRGCETKK
ncbi:hypothetical protein UP17_01045 [Peribacillus simplex]|nr:hypothetical protein UP17_01045 [Peribacillus simplex]